jgi:polysaccharide pyruvyl transferase WcaK-like protein
MGMRKLAKQGRRVRICFYGHFGTSNSGNESTLLAVLYRLRAVFPEGEFCCICSHPEVIARTLGIEAVPISSRTSRIWDRGSRLTRRLRVVPVGIVEELHQYVRGFKSLRGTDMLIVPGTGLLTDAYGLSAWGPYNTFKWSLLAKLRGCSLVFVSVGAGPIDTRLGRALVKSALSLADYRSYRDDASADYLKNIGFQTNGDRVYPDLVFDLPAAPEIPLEHAAERRRVVGLGLMSYAGKYSVANPTDETYRAYLESLVVFVRWLLDHDYSVRLLLGDADTNVIDEFTSLLRERIGDYDEGRVLYQPLGSVEEILSRLAATDVVVATRFHNVLLALLLNKPVIAISFHHKCYSLMNSMGLSEYCHDINQMDSDALIGQFQDLEENSDELKRVITQRVEESRRSLDEQYELLFSASGGPVVHRDERDGLAPVPTGSG